MAGLPLVAGCHFWRLQQPRRGVQSPGRPHGVRHPQAAEPRGQQSAATAAC